MFLCLLHSVHFHANTSRDPYDIRDQSLVYNHSRVDQILPHIHLCGYMTAIGTITNVQTLHSAQSIPGYTTKVGTIGSKPNGLKEFSAAQSLCERMMDCRLSHEAKGMLGSGVVVAGLLGK